MAPLRSIKNLSRNRLGPGLPVPHPMLPDGGKKRLEQLGIRANDQSGIGFQLQHIQQLPGLAMQRDRLQMLVGLQQVMQRTPSPLNALIDAEPPGTNTASNATDGRPSIDASTGSDLPS